MSLRAKILLILSLVVLLFAALDHGIQQVVVFPQFQGIEREAAEKDAQRVVDAIQGEILHLDRRCEDWAAWDDTWNYVLQPNAAYVESNLGPEGFHKNDINLLYICDLEGRVVWGGILDLDGDRPLSLREFPAQALSLSHPLLSERGRKPGLWMTEGGPLLVSAKPILDSRRHGPERGTVIMGRFLDPALVSALGERTGVPFEVARVGGADLPESDREILDEVTTSAAAVVREQDATRLHAWRTFSDTNEAPALLIRATCKRDVTQKGAASVRYALVSTIAAGLLIMLVLLNLLQHTVLRPIATLTAHAVTIGRNDETTRKLNLDRKDEIGVLSREFDSMMEKLSRSRTALLEAARAAGMSEIATAVLHNVGNVLNSVNVSAKIVSEKARSSSADDLKKTLQAVEDSAGDLATFLARDPRAAHLQPLLVSLSEELAIERTTILAEVDRLAHGIEHIQELVAAQQSYAGRSGVLERTSIAETIAAAIAMTSPAAIGAGEIEIARELDEVPPCAVDRHRLTEVLVNLVRNAREAVAEASSAAPRIAVRLLRPASGRVRIEVEDDGVGIPAENLNRIFTHGFTTKRNGHGFGLHASANAAVEMGGTLCARSDGPGRGAIFVLEIPVREIESDAPVGAAA